MNPDHRNPRFILQRPRSFGVIPAPFSPSDVAARLGYEFEKGVGSLPYDAWLDKGLPVIHNAYFLPFAPRSAKV